MGKHLLSDREMSDIKVEAYERGYRAGRVDGYDIGYSDGVYDTEAAFKD